MSTDLSHLPEWHQALCRRLRAMRKARGWSGRELGERAGGIHKVEISMYERGVREPSLARLHALAGALEVSAAELLTEETT